jgi:hypothetical protein
VFVLYAGHDATPPSPAPGVRMIHLTEAYAEGARPRRRGFPDLARHVDEAVGRSLAVRDWLAAHAAVKNLYRGFHHF